jgi:type I restriction enzyme S subunit
LILSAVAANTANITKSIDTELQQATLVREYRTSLIADVVTGKLDVREAAARLPDEAEEPEPLDETAVLTNAEDVTADVLDAAAEVPGE